MRNNFIIMAIAVLVVLDITARVAPSEGGASPQQSSWENEDGTVGMSELPATENVVDSAGAVVGVLKTADDMVGIYPLPVYGRSGEVVGYVGENGFWALGETPPVAGK